ncbi:MAG TPA: hypothetical protein VGP07_12665 [Polyangia bacterium]|jgi:hypothetical protein
MRTDSISSPNQNLSRLLLVLGALLAVPACGDQSSPELIGQATATLEGTITNHRTTPLPDADIVIAWPDFSQAIPGDFVVTNDYSATVRQPVSSTLPAAFRLDLLSPPPETAFPPPTPGWSGPRLAVGYISIVKRGEAPTSGNDSNVIQTVQDFVISFADGTGDIVGPPDDKGTIFRFPVTKGYTLNGQRIEFCPSYVDAACVAAQSGTLSKARVDWLCGSSSDGEITTGVVTPFSTPITVDLTDSNTAWVPADLAEKCPLY